MSLEGKLILVTGSGIRLGREISLAIARAGGDVVIHYNHSQEDAQGLTREIEQLGRKAYSLQADFYDSNQIISLIPRASEFGRLFGLVNSASIFGTQTWDNTTLEEWDRHLLVNLTAPFLLSQAFARQVPTDGHGRIINMLDWRGERPGTDHFPYTIAKSALGALTKSLAIAFAPRITLNGLALGAILPPSGGKMPREAIEKAPARRQANLDEVTQSVIFLLEGPEYITGDIIYVDGGRHLV